MRTLVFWGLYWGPPILGNYHLGGFKRSERILGFGWLGFRVGFRVLVLDPVGEG